MLYLYVTIAITSMTCKQVWNIQVLKLLICFFPNLRPQENGAIGAAVLASQLGNNDKQNK
jgi:hypothetical protein